MIQGLLAKAWIKHTAELAPGEHYFEEEIVVRVRGTVEKLEDELAAPTVSIPLVATLAYFCDRLWIARDEALAGLRDALHQAMTHGEKKDDEIQSRIDLEAAMKDVRTKLIAGLPKMHREGKLLIDGLRVEVESIVTRDTDLLAA